MDPVKDETSAISYDAFEIDHISRVISFLYSARRVDGTILEKFSTELHVPDLLERDLTLAERFVVLCFGLVRYAGGRCAHMARTQGGQSH